MTPAFVIGTPRTGTTLLTRLLYQHEDVVGLHESYVLKPGVEPSVCRLGGARAHGFSVEQATRWRSIAESQPPAEALRTVLTEAWEAMGTRPVCMDSWPFYAEHMDTLDRAFPGARYIFTTRSEEAIWRSAIRKWGTGERTLDQYRRAQEILAGRSDVYVVPFGRLVTDPWDTLHSLWKRLGLDPARGWLEYDPARDPAPQRWASDPKAIEWPDRSKAADTEERLRRLEAEVERLRRRRYEVRYESVCDNGPNGDLVTSAGLVPYVVCVDPGDWDEPEGEL